MITAFSVHSGKILTESETAERATGIRRLQAEIALRYETSLHAMFTAKHVS